MCKDWIDDIQVEEFSSILEVRGFAKNGERESVAEEERTARNNMELLKLQFRVYKNHR